MIHFGKIWIGVLFASTYRQAPEVLIQGQIGQGVKVNTHSNLVPKVNKCCSYTWPRRQRPTVGCWTISLGLY
jgi:hypothetical protein